MTHNLITYHVNNARAGEIIRQFKHERDLTNDDLEEMTGISSATIKNILKGTGVLTLERAIKFCALFEIPIVSLVALLVEGVPIDFANKILTYNPATGKTMPITDERVNPISDTIPDEIAEAALATPAIDPLPASVAHDHTEHVAHIEDLRAEIARQDATIRQLLDILAKR